MKTLYHQSMDPYYNLALEEYLLKEYPLTDDLFYLWRNDTSVIIGRNQSPIKEVKTQYASTKNIPIIRRISGGGTVVHDPGNINFTYITNDTKKVNDYRYFLDPIIEVLKQVGIPAQFVPKSHIYVGEKKISGNAQSVYKGKLIHHGTILYDMDLDLASKLLKSKLNLQGNFVESNRADIQNIKDLIPFKTTITEFMSFLQSELFLNDSKISMLTLHSEDQNKIKKLVETKYKQDSWNFKTNKELTINEPDFNATVSNGVIVKCDITELVNIPLSYNQVEKALSHHKDKESILMKLF